MKYDRWKRIIFSIVFCLFCLTQIAPQSVQAANGQSEDREEKIEDKTKGLRENERMRFTSVTDYRVDLNTTGSIRIHDRYGEGVHYNLYLIAEFSKEGSAYYTDELSAYADELSGLPNDLKSASDAEAMTEGLAKIISGHNIAAEIGPLTVGSDGYVSFRNLKPGYYLVLTSAEKRADGKVYSASPILVSVPEGADPELGYVDYAIQIDAKSELEEETKEKKEQPPVESPKSPKSQKPTKSSKTSKPSNHSKVSRKLGEKLPQTGALWWPLPFLFAGGLLLYVLGIFIEKKAQAADRKK